MGVLSKRISYDLRFIVRTCWQVEGSLRLQLVLNVVVAPDLRFEIEIQILVIVGLNYLIFKILNVVIDVETYLNVLVELWVNHYFFLHLVCKILDHQKFEVLSVRFFKLFFVHFLPTLFALVVHFFVQLQVAQICFVGLVKHVGEKVEFILLVLNALMGSYILKT